MKILGIDPGMATTGWGIVRRLTPQTFSIVRCGCIVTPAGTAMPLRLEELARDLRELVRAEQPEAAAVEELFFAKNSRTAASVGHARGVILLVLRELGLPVFEYNPRKVKIALTGFGSADKYQMQHMVQRLLKLRALPKPDDAADALAIALCHLQTMPMPVQRPVRVALG